MKAEDRFFISKENIFRLAISNPELAINHSVEFYLQTDKTPNSLFKHINVPILKNKLHDFLNWLAWSKNKNYKGFIKKIQKINKFQPKVKKIISKNKTPSLSPKKNPFSDENEGSDFSDYEETKRRFIKNLGFKNKVKRKLRRKLDPEQRKKLKFGDMEDFNLIFNYKNQDFKEKFILKQNQITQEKRESKMMFNNLKDINFPEDYDEYFFKKKKELILLGNKRHGVFDYKMLLHHQIKLGYIDILPDFFYINRKLFYF